MNCIEMDYIKKKILGDKSPRTYSVKDALDEELKDIKAKLMKFVDSYEDYRLDVKDYDGDRRSNLIFYKGDNKWDEIHGMTVYEFEQMCENSSDLTSEEITYMIVSKLLRAFVLKDICKNICINTGKPKVNCIVADDYYIIRDRANGKMLSFYLYKFTEVLRTDMKHIVGPALAKVIADMMTACVIDDRVYSYKDVYLVTRCLGNVISTRTLSYTTIANYVYSYLNEDKTKRQIEEEICDGLYSIVFDIVPRDFSDGITGLSYYS